MYKGAKLNLPLQIVTLCPRYINNILFYYFRFFHQQIYGPPAPLCPGQQLISCPGGLHSIPFCRLYFFDNLPNLNVE